MSSTPIRYVLTVGEDQHEPSFASWHMVCDNGNVSDTCNCGFFELTDMPTDRDGWLSLVKALQPAGTRLLAAEPTGYGWEIIWITA